MSDSSPGFQQGYSTVLAALAGGNPGAFALLTSRGLPVPVEIFSDEINFGAVANTPWGGNWPTTLAGLYFLPTVSRLELSVLSGVQTINGGFKSGTNGTFDNVLAANTVPFATLTSMIANGVSKQAAISSVLGTTMAYPELTAAPTVSVTTATSAPCKGRLVMTGVLRAVIP